ncbi:uncharacterized protein LOC124929220 [Impatiens glandulifera]|uniref:uncharacterized protein LOC124929220 n=1 Tax=Impatiens glandulifera TaxID=253017 RepID=UPI001FB1208B|nr:uncharacterized protein LOC124929220 [Impatiens glandulifera]
MANCTSLLFHFPIKSSPSIPPQFESLNLPYLLKRNRRDQFCRGRGFGPPSSIRINPVVAATSYSQTGPYVGKTNSKLYERTDSCLIFPPPRGKKPRAIIKFLGGAFIGKVPEVTYGYLLQLLAREGYIIICVPYNVTFDHAQATQEIYDRFNACIDKLRSSGLPSANLTSAELANLPLYSVGHSNGALLQVLTGSYFCDAIPKANVIISYNNRPATEAVPYFEQLGPLVSQMMPMIEESPIYSMARSASDILKGLLDMTGEMLPDYDPDARISARNFVDQLPLVFNQVTTGISEFKPTPSENRSFCRESYNVQHTLLVKFNLDTIDETDLLEETLKPRVESISGTLNKVVLTGNHVTPCVQEPQWQVGNMYTPGDAIRQGVESVLLNDIRVLSKTISSWFSSFDDQN